MTMFVLIEPDPAYSEYLDGGILRINGPFASEDEARKWGQQNGKNLHHIHPVEDTGQHALPDDVEAVVQLTQCIGYAWVDPATGVRRVLNPEDVTVIISADATGGSANAQPGSAHR